MKINYEFRLFCKDLVDGHKNKTRAPHVLAVKKNEKQIYLVARLESHSSSIVEQNIYTSRLYYSRKSHEARRSDTLTVRRSQGRPCTAVAAQRRPTGELEPIPFKFFDLRGTRQTISLGWLNKAG
jgi:hypothetical protein